MKRPSNQVLGTSSADHMPREQSPGSQLTKLPEADALYSQPQQDFAQLLAQYKRAAYEALERWDQEVNVVS